MRGQSVCNTRPHVRLPPSFLAMDACMTSQLNVALIRKLLWSLMCLAYFFDILSRGVCRHWQTSGRSTDAGIKCLYCIPSSQVYSVRWVWWFRVKQSFSSIVLLLRDLKLDTIQTFNSCTSRPDVCHSLVVHTPMHNM